MKDLYKAFKLIENQQEFEDFLKDLCTPQELIALKERWDIVLLLAKGTTYREIHQQNGASLATITRVARFLKHEQNQGYKLILERMMKNSLSS